MIQPKWTVLYNIQGKWIGSGWQFFDTEAEAKACYDTQVALGNCPCMRPYHTNDFEHLGAYHRMQKEKYEKSD